MTILLSEFGGLAFGMAQTLAARLRTAASLDSGLVHLGASFSTSFTWLKSSRHVTDRLEAMQEKAICSLCWSLHWSSSALPLSDIHYNA